MEETSRAFAVLAALTVALAPVTNGVLEEAARTADRVILEPADWDREPPEDPPNATPPEDLPDDGNQTFEGAGAQPRCEIETEPVAVWTHPPDPTSPNRTLDPEAVSFETNESHVGIGVALQITNLTGELEANLEHEEGYEGFSYAHPAFSGQKSEVNRTSTVPREDLETGEWTAQITHRTASYDRLAYVVVVASCAEGTA